MSSLLLVVAFYSLAEIVHPLCIPGVVRITVMSRGLWAGGVQGIEDSRVHFTEELVKFLGGERVGDMELPLT